MNLLVTDPNFSIVLPGCNAACDFCFAEKYKSCDKSTYLKNLEVTLKNLQKEFFQISITGGEPTIHPWFSDVLDVVSKYRSRYTKVVLTSNGTKLKEHLYKIVGTVDHINLSVHHYNDEQNRKIFKGTYSLSSKDHSDIIDSFGAEGIDVSLSCVIDDDTTKKFIDKYIDYAKDIGARSIRFRKVNGDNIPVKVESDFEKYKVVWTGSCPVCVSRKRIIKGLDVYWKTSVIEPDTVTNGRIFELIFNPDGYVYSDWKGQHPVVGAEKKKVSYFDEALNKNNIKGRVAPRNSTTRILSASEVLEAVTSDLVTDAPKSYFDDVKKKPTGLAFAGRSTHTASTSCGSGTSCGSLGRPTKTYNPPATSCGGGYSFSSCGNAYGCGR